MKNPVRVIPLPDGHQTFDGIPELTLVITSDRTTVYVRGSEWALMRPELEAVFGLEVHRVQ